jgi:hypothetical protein
MTIERIRKVYSAEPFQPFTLHLADGRSLSIPHREFLALGPSGRTVLVFTPDGDFHIVDLPLVTDLHVQGKASAGGNGQSN